MFRCAEKHETPKPQDPETANPKTEASDSDPQLVQAYGWRLPQVALGFRVSGFEILLFQVARLGLGLSSGLGCRV